MQNNNHIEELIIKYFSKTISAEEKSLLQAWINESAENKRYFQEIQNIWHVSHPAFHPEDIDLDKAKTKILNQIEHKPSKNISFIVWWQRVAAILIVPVMMLIAYQLYSDSLYKSDVAYQEIIAPLGMKSKITLPDSSTVWLNSGSKLKYPVVFTSGKRNVYLSGEAFFKVNSDKSHPFVVSTNNLQVSATGTAFNIESYANDTITAVTLLEGKINVQVGEMKSEHIMPNHRLVYNSKNNKYDIAKTDAKHWCIWKDGILAFRNESLENVFKRIGRTYNVDIVVKDKSVGRQLYRATFEGESLDEILRLLKLSAPIKYKRSGREQQSDNEFSKERIEVYNAN